jgi:general stress protein 26
MADELAVEVVKGVLRSQNLGVLATFGEKYPYTSLVGFVAGEDAHVIVFSTLRNTRKFSYLVTRPKVSILINNGLNSSSDFKDAAAVTALGEAVEVASSEEGLFRALYLGKFPFLEDFVNDPNCVFVKVEVEKYIVVNGLREIREFVPGAKL